MNRRRRPSSSSNAAALTAPPGVAVVRGERARVRLRGPGALAACLPQLIGFHPVESVVVVGMIRGRTNKHEVGLTLRVDLDDLINAVHVADAAEDGPLPCHPRSIAAALARNRCVAATVIVVSERCAPPGQRTDRTDPGADILLDLVPALAAAGLKVLDELLVRDGRWWSYQCTRASCCPVEGTPLDQGDADLLTAELVWAGEQSTVLASRELIASKVAPATGLQVDALAATLAASPERPWLASATPTEALATVADLIARFAVAATEGVAEPDVSVDEWARVLVDLTDIRVRDACLATWKGDVGAATLQLWCSATRIAPPGHLAPVATLAALVAYARGDGALAGEAITRALDDDPGYRMAGYTAQALGGGIPPTDIRRMFVASHATMRAWGSPLLDASGTVIPERPPPARRPRVGPGAAGNP